MKNDARIFMEIASIEFIDMEIAEMYQECTTKFIFLQVRVKIKLLNVRLKLDCYVPQIFVMEVTSLKIILYRYHSLTRPKNCK